MMKVTREEFLGSDAEETVDVLRARVELLDDINKFLRGENERLRDLVREMSSPYKYGEADCGLCPHTDKCWDSETLDFNPDGCAILQMVREHGIEV